MMFDLKVLVLALLVTVGVLASSVVSRPDAGWWIQPNIPAIRTKIVKVANSKIGLTDWSVASSCCHGPNTWKCNYFVYDVGREAGAKMPTRSLWRGPIGAGTWGTASKVNYWRQVTSPQLGDVIAGHRNNAYHVGIYVGHRTVVSANSHDIGSNSNMYTKGYQGIVYWRYDGV